MKKIITNGGICMALIKCQECKNKISDSVENCPKCGKAISESDILFYFDKERTKKKRIIIISLSVVVLIVLAVSSIFAIKYINEKKEEDKRIEEEKSKEDEFYKNSSLYCSKLKTVHDNWLDYTKKKRDVWINCIWQKDDDYTDDYTKNSKGKFYDDFNDALSEFSYDEMTEELFEECLKCVADDKSLFNKIAPYKSKNKNVSEIKKLISEVHETVTNMYKMEDSYGYNYDEYDEKMDAYLSEIEDKQTKIESKISER